MKDFPIVKPRQLVMALVMSCFMTIPAQAGFIEDFYEDSAGLGQGNVTTAGIYQSSGLNVVTGGGFVYRAPRTEFTPFHFSPPKLSAGCGGIDLVGHGVLGDGGHLALLRVRPGQNGLLQLLRQLLEDGPVLCKLHRPPPFLVG